MHRRLVEASLSPPETCLIILLVMKTATASASFNTRALIEKSTLLVSGRYSEAYEAVHAHVCCVACSV